MKEDVQKKRKKLGINIYLWYGMWLYVFGGAFFASVIYEVEWSKLAQKCRCGICESRRLQNRTPLHSAV
jgi:hypothetical protein